MPKPEKRKETEKMKIRYLQIFLCVCDNKNSVTKAAKALFMTQPAVTQAIQELEEYYQIRLFDRISRRLYLTAAGKEFETYARRAIGIFQDMESRFTNWDNFGTLRVGASTTCGTCLMPQIIRAFQKTHPESKIRVTIQPSRFLQEKLMHNELDLALVETPVQNETLYADLLFADRLCVIGSQEFGIDPDSPMTKESFAGMSFLLREPGSGSRDIFDRVLDQEGFSVTPNWEAESTTALIKAVEEGMGISVLPRLLVTDAIHKGRVKEIRVEEMDFRQDFYLVHHKDKMITGLIKDFIAVAENICTFPE